MKTHKTKAHAHEHLHTTKVNKTMRPYSGRLQNLKKCATYNNTIKKNIITELLIVIITEIN